MAIDTEDKRRSVSSWYCRIPPVPDWGISRLDSQHVAGFYRGIAAGTPPVLVELSVGLSISTDLATGILFE